MPNCIERVAGEERLDTSLSIAKEFKDYLNNNIRDIIMINSNASKVDLPIIGYYGSKIGCPVILADFGYATEIGI